MSSFRCLANKAVRYLRNEMEGKYLITAFASMFFLSIYGFSQYRESPELFRLSPRKKYSPSGISYVKSPVIHLFFEIRLIQLFTIYKHFAAIHRIASNLDVISRHSDETLYVMKCFCVLKRCSAIRTSIRIDIFDMCTACAADTTESPRSGSPNT